MNSLQLNFLGVPALLRDGQPVRLVRAKGLALLLYLAVTRVAQPREQVMDLLWPASPPQAARKNMRNTLWAIREALGDSVLDFDGSLLGLAAAVRVDLHAFEDGLRLLESGQAAELEAVLALYRGSLAAGLMIQDAAEFESWLTIERERMTTTYLRLIERLTQLLRAAGDWQALIAAAIRALAAEPLHERMHLLVIEAHLRLGQRTQASQQYAALVEILGRELDVEPLPETTARYEALLADRLPEPPAPRPRPALPAAPAPFVGRRGELVALNAEYQRAAHGEARVVLIAGELGIGKSALWQAWRVSLPATTRVLTTRALETSDPVPFGPLLALFRPGSPAAYMLAPSSPLAPIWLTELARLLPEIAAGRPDLPRPLSLSPAEERARLFQALGQALRLLAPPQLVLVVEDLHWADPSTLDLLVYLVEHLHDQPLLLIGTYRPQEAPEQLALIAASWQRHNRLLQVVLSHLSISESRLLLRCWGQASNATAQEHWIEQSGGNPYFLLELCRAPAGDPPGDLAGLVRARIRAIMPASAQQVLQAAAILGDDADLALLRATSGRSEEETVDALDSLLAAAVLTLQGNVYRFVHPFVASVVAQDLSAARRVFLHRRAANALLQAYRRQPGRVAPALMGHFAAAGDWLRAAQYAELAATQATAIGAYAEAAGYARRALGWEPTARRRFLLGNALTVAGAADEAQVQLHAAFAEFQQAGDAAGATAAIVALARLAIATGQSDQAQIWLHQAPVEQAQQRAPELGVEVHLLSAGVYRHRREFALAEAELDRADQLVRQHRLPVQAAQSAFERGNLLANQGQLSVALELFAQSLQLTRVAGLTQMEAMSHNNLAFHALLAGDLERAQQHVQAGMELAERLALDLLWQYLYCTLGEIALAQGQLDVADDALARAILAARAWDNQTHVANVLVNQAYVAQARGEYVRARALVDQAAAVFGKAADSFVREKITRARIELT